MELITIKWFSIVIFVVVWGAFSFLYNRFLGRSPVPDGSSLHSERIKFFSFSFAVFGVVSSTLLTSFNSLESTATVHEKIDFDRMENSFKYMDRWESSSLKEARDATREIKNLASTPDWTPNKLVEMIDGPKLNGAKDTRESEKIKAQQKLERSVISMFNFFEEIELSIEVNRVNPEVLKRAFQETYVMMYDRFKPWLEVHKADDEEQYRHLKKLRNRWRIE